MTSVTINNGTRENNRELTEVDELTEAKLRGVAGGSSTPVVSPSHKDFVIAKSNRRREPRFLLMIIRGLSPKAWLPAEAAYIEQLGQKTSVGKCEPG